MEDRIPLKYIILPVVAVVLAVLIVVLNKVQIPGRKDPGGKNNPTGTPAASKADPSIFEYERDANGTLKVMGFTADFEEEYLKNPGFSKGFTDGVLLIPAEKDGEKVTAVGADAFQKDNRIKKLVLPKGIVTVEDYAFESCVNLEAIDFPDGLREINDCAFFGCIALKTVTLPKTATKVEAYAFVGCDSLTEISVPFSDSIADIFGTDTVKKITVTDGSSIAEDAFFMLEAVETIIIEADITLINQYAFADCKTLKSVKIPDGLLSLGDNAFENCVALTDVTLPEGLSLIGEFAFSGCAALKSLTIPKSVNNIGQQAFEGCESLTLTVYAESEGEDYAVKEELNYKLK